MILIIDFGGQTAHLIGRRVRELGVSVQIVEPEEALSHVERFTPRGIILSGGPSSVYAKTGLLIDKKIYGYGIPVLGICYGLQDMAHQLGGKVMPGKKKEYGRAEFYIKKPCTLFAGLSGTQQVWMSHFDQVVRPPKGAIIAGSTSTVAVAAFADEKKKFYGIQFHPEVHHTPSGRKILSNFIFDICGEISTDQKISSKEIVSHIKETIGNNAAVCALSGGIDSAVAAVLTHQAIGNNLTCFYVDTGMMRLSETKEIENTFKTHFHLDIKVIHAEEEFLDNLKDVFDPEKKRKIIGETFIRIFEREALRLQKMEPQSKPMILVQGTIYPDVIESKGTKHAHTIKTHHNVGGLPEKHGFTIVEPLRMLYKDEVREIAKELDFPHDLIWRHVFPGPGLGVRVIGEVTKEKLDIVRRADAIVIDEIKKAGWYEKVWMAFAVLTGVKSTGVGGDERKYGETIAIRVIESKDTMTADWVRLPYDLLSRISSRITNEVFEVVRVVYDITTKPPATMEWE